MCLSGFGHIDVPMIRWVWQFVKDAPSTAGLRTWILIVRVRGLLAVYALVVIIGKALIDLRNEGSMMNIPGGGLTWVVVRLLFVDSRTQIARLSVCNLFDIATRTRKTTRPDRLLRSPR
jgi:hypothetical protein